MLLLKKDSIYSILSQNIHLVKKWLPSLEKKMESFANGCHDDFRFFMSAEPAATAAAHIIPQGILESSIKITNEPPTGMQVCVITFDVWIYARRNYYDVTSKVTFMNGILFQKMLHFRQTYTKLLTTSTKRH